MNISVVVVPKVHNLSPIILEILVVGRYTQVFTRKGQCYAN